MADPKVMKEGERDVELEKAQKGYQKYEAENQAAQKKLDEQDKKAVETMQKVKEKVKSFLPFQAGGVVKRHEYSAPSKSSASKRADGIAVKGKTRGKIC